MKSIQSFRILRAAALALVLTTAALPLAAQKKTGYLRTRIDPHVAGVFVDGKYVGTAAMYGNRARMLELSPGAHQVEIVDPRYKTLKVKANITAGMTTTIRRSLEPATVDKKGPFGEFVTEGFGNSAVYLNGAYYGNTAEFGTPGQSLLLRPGTYSMKIVSVAGDNVREEEIKINAEETLVLSKTAADVRRK